MGGPPRRITVERRFARFNDPKSYAGRERKLLVQPPTLYRSKGRGQTKCSPGSSRLRAGRGANDPTAENTTVTKPWRRPKPTQGCNANKKWGNRNFQSPQAPRTLLDPLHILSVAKVLYGASTLATAKTLRSEAPLIPMALAMHELKSKQFRH
jgi:hypothetical protein